MSDVFLSYKAEDRARVRPLVKALEEDGFSVWWDEQIGGGSAWRQAIEAELDAAQCVVVVWSKRSAGPEGTFVQDEATRAQQRGAYIPVLIDRVRLPLGFGETHALQLLGWRGDRSDPRYAALLEAIRRVAVPSERRVGSPARLVPQSRRTLIIGGSAAVLAAAGAGAWMLLRPSAEAVGSTSIAVLPFDNLSGDPSQAYFADGIAEEVRNALTRIPKLKVVARTSSEAVRSDDAKTAARKLSVRNILAGSIRRSSSVVRVSAQLIDGRTGLERWSETFDQPIGDALNIQSNIAAKVAAALRIQLAETGTTILNLGGTDNLAAQDLYLKARLSSAPDTAEALRESVGNLDGAIALDPKFAQAYALKSDLLAYFGAQYARSTSEMQTLFKAAAANANMAISLAPRLAQSHSALGFALNFQLKFPEALREMETAVGLPGADADVHGRLALLLAESGRTEASLKAATNAVLLDPLNPQSYQEQAVVLYLGWYFEQTVAAARRSLELNPTRIFVRGILGNALLMMGRNDEAAAEFANMPSDSWQALAGRAIIAARKGNLHASDQLVEQLRASWGDSATSQFAEIYAQRGDADRAMDYLQNPAQRDAGFIFIARDPLLRPIHADPRFQRIIRGLGLI